MEDKSVLIINEVISNHIPIDLVFSILSKLSLKSLKRFGCVCKSWTLLFENSDFMSLYRNNFTSTPLLLKQWAIPVSGEQHHSWLYLLSGERFENRVSLDWPLPLQDDDSYINILGSCANGVFCLLTGDESPVLWNPTTKEFKVIPHSLVEFGRPYRQPSKNHCGFGYDHVRDDYKVIRHVSFLFFDEEYLERFGLLHDGACDVENISFEPLWEIYSLRSNSWKKLDLEMPDTCWSIQIGSRTYTDGMCHWWGTKEIYLASCLVSFDMSNEVFFTTPMPSYMGDTSFDFGTMEVHLAVLNGSVAFICNPAEETTFHISMLGEVGVKESWTKLFVIGPLPCVEKLIGAGNNGNIFFKTKYGEIAWFDWSTQMIVDLDIKDQGEYSQVVTYKKNLESLIDIGLIK